MKYVVSEAAAERLKRETDSSEVIEAIRYAAGFAFMAEVQVGENQYFTPGLQVELHVSLVEETIEFYTQWSVQGYHVEVVDLDEDHSFYAYRDESGEWDMAD